MEAQELRDELNEKVSRLDIAWYLKSECEYFLKHLNSYKLENLKWNFTLFKKYLILLDNQQTKQVKAVISNLAKTDGKVKNLGFFFSKRGQRALGDKVKYIATNGTVVQKVMQKIKAIFLFQATEFVNGSQLRMKVIDFKRIHDTIVRKCKVIA